MGAFEVRLSRTIDLSVPSCTGFHRLPETGTRASLTKSARPGWDVMQLVDRVVHGVHWRVAELLRRARRAAYPVAVRTTWSRVRAEHLSYSTDHQLRQLLAVVHRTAASGALILEAGCARGGSSILMCAAKSPQRPMRVYDLFEMLPPLRLLSRTPAYHANALKRLTKNASRPLKCRSVQPA